MRLPASSRRRSSSCRIRKCSATCARRPRITTAGSRAWRRSRRRCGKLTGSDLRHCERSEALHAAAQRKLDCFASLAIVNMHSNDGVDSALLRVERLDREIHHNLDQVDTAMREAALQRGLAHGGVNLIEVMVDFAVQTLYAQKG